MKTLLDCIKQGGSESLQLKGSRIVREKHTSDDQRGNRNQGRSKNMDRNQFPYRNCDERGSRDISESGRTSEGRTSNAIVQEMVEDRTMVVEIIHRVETENR